LNGGSISADVSASASASASGSSASASATSEECKQKQQWRITVANVGDSRAVLIKASGRCIAMTEDHKPSAAVEHERIRAAGGFVSANRVDGQLAMSRAIGDWSYKGDAHLPVTKQKVIALPDVTVQTAEAGDALLLCCDGIVEQMTNEDAAAYVHAQMQQPSAAADPAVVMSGLLDYSLEKGSKDNMTAMLIMFTDGNGYEAKQQYLPGPYYGDSREFVEAFKADAKRHGLEGSELEKFVQQAIALPKPEHPPGSRANPSAAALGMGGSGMSVDDDDDDGSGGSGGSGSGSGSTGAGAGDDDDDLSLDMNSLSQKEKLMALMELLQKNAGVSIMNQDRELDHDQDDLDDDQDDNMRTGTHNGARITEIKPDSAKEESTRKAKKNARKKAKKSAKKAKGVDKDGTS
jgi:serine/threonine protein phosphatase PrpC